MKIFGTISEIVKVAFRLSGGKELRLEVNDTQTGSGPVVVTIPNVGSNSANLVTTGDSGTVTSAMIATETITDGDISLAAGISRSKVAAGTTGDVLINDPSTGALSSEAQLAKTRGGTGISSTATFPASGVVATHSDKLNAFASTTSAELAGVISDAAGFGDLVFNDSPTINNLSTYSTTDVSYKKTNVTISAGAITASTAFTRLTGTASNIQTINFSPGATEGRILVLTNECSPAAEVTLVNSTGNVLTGTGEDFVLKANAAVTLIYDATSTKWKLTGGAGAGGGATTDKISAVGLAEGDVVALSSTGYIKAITDASSTAEVVGIVTKVITADVEYEITLLGEVGVTPGNFVDETGTPLVVTPTSGTVIFASNVTAGKLTTWEPATLGHVSVPVGIMLPTSGKMYFLPKRGTVVGGTNARTQLPLTSGGTATIFDAESPTLYPAGELTGWIELGTTAKFYFRAPFAQNGAGTDWNVSPSYVGDTPPAGFSITMANTGAITVTCPTFSGTGLINYALNAPAVGATFPLAVDAASLTTGTVAAARLPVVVPGTSAGVVAAAGLPGNTTGSAIAAGYVGEAAGTLRSGSGGFTYSVRSTTAVPTTTQSAVISLSLNKGVYLVSYKIKCASNSAANLEVAFYIGATQVDATNGDGYVTPSYFGSVSNTLPIIISSDSTTVSVYASVSAGTSSGNSHELWAVRIA